MEQAANTTEQQQLLVEIEAVTTNIGKQTDPQKASYEVQQGRKLIEKAVSLKLPEGSYAALKGLLEKQDGAPR